MFKAFVFILDTRTKTINDLINDAALLDSKTHDICHLLITWSTFTHVQQQLVSDAVSNLQRFLPRDATLARYMLWLYVFVCPSICPSQAGII